MLADAAPTTGLVLAVLGDSVGAGIGDPALGGGWRGFAPLLAEALGDARLTNFAVSGSRIGGVLETQLPAALALRPDVTVVLVGMNDTMRSDFDPGRLSADLDHVVGTLVAAGSTVITAKYHDHHRVFRLPGPLRRALASRILALNEILDAVARKHRIGIVDLGQVPGIYTPEAWAVDRLHPSELGHRMLARAIAAQLTAFGTIVHKEVSLQCAGGRAPGKLARWAWLVFKGLPWLLRRGRDLVPYALATLLRRS
ncbi:SGNH/GDSL hydrolase family protein [Actinophytocola sp. NPDC049390]|uniref:SGNH/GDSL hydrolase family protein n=1 Tax=Actinophytocola sp. NPDC049390 TaxID=3363894 RepID=UPI003794616B